MTKIQLNGEYEHKLARCSELDKILCKLYEDNALGKIPDSRYERMASEYETEQAEIRQSLSELSVRLEKLKSNSDCAVKFINVIRKYTNVEKLDAAILNQQHMVGGSSPFTGFSRAMPCTRYVPHAVAGRFLLARPKKSFL